MSIDSKSMQASTGSPWRFSVAPMMDWTDRHCRYFHRLISRRVRLYTEMVTTGAILHGDLERLLGFDAAEHPLALQLGGSEPEDLARAARVGERFGYDEINLNCGCPSERVQRGAFGACLMNEPALVADGVKAMQDAVSVPVTIKHRIGLGRNESLDLVRDFVSCLFDAGCRVFIVHARNAWLEGLSPKDNREIPPLRYAVVQQLKADFPDAVFVLNGGLTAVDSALEQARGLDGVMFGRAAYHQPWMLREVDARSALAAQTMPILAMEGAHAASDGVSDDAAPVCSKASGPEIAPTRDDVLEGLVAYARREGARGVPLRSIVRHVLGLYHGEPGARAFRRTLSDSTLLRDADHTLIWRAREAMRT